MMIRHVAVIVRGAVAGPLAAKFCAKQKLKTLLVEKYQVPRF
jgi:hypothetical protein